MPTILAVVEHTSKAAFYVAGGVLAAWAILVGAIGVTRPAFPHGERGGRVVMAVTFLLVVAAMATAVATA
jgi:hypothetical protein